MNQSLKNGKTKTCTGDELKGTKDDEIFPRFTSLLKTEEGPDSGVWDSRARSLTWVGLSKSETENAHKTMKSREALPV